MYTILKWNGKYSSDCKFVIQDNKNGKQSVFTPGRVSDLVWTTNKLDTTPEISKWEDFGDEKVDNLEDVAM